MAAPPETTQLEAATNTNNRRRTNSLVLNRTSIPLSLLSTPDDDDDAGIKPRTRRVSLSSPWPSRPTESENKGGLKNWKPIRVLSHIGKQKLSCLLSVEVVTIQGLPASMNGLRLSVSVKKKETKEGAIQTMPSRVSQGVADFEETLFVRCHMYAAAAGKFEPRPFVLHAYAVDAQELDFGRHTVDLSQLMTQESVEKKNLEGTRIQQWDMSFKLSGKAKGGELVIKLGFQIMDKEAGGAGIYNQVEGMYKSTKSKSFSSTFGRRQSRSSFSIPSPRIPKRREEGNVDFQAIDDLSLDAPPQEPVVQKTEEEPETKAEDQDLPDVEVQKTEEKAEDLDVPDFEVADEGVDVEQSEDNSEKRSVVSSEVVVVDDEAHLTRLSELDSIPQQIKAVESMMEEDKTNENVDEDAESQQLDEDEEDKATGESLQMLENEDGKETAMSQGRNVNTASSVGGEDEDEPKVFVQVLGKGLGCVILCLGAVKLMLKLVAS